MKRAKNHAPRRGQSLVPSDKNNPTVEKSNKADSGANQTKWRLSM
jgi:hypothetical protein